MTSDPHNEMTAASGKSPALWAGVLGAPLAWALQLQLGYALAPHLCKSQTNWSYYLVTAVCALIAIIGGMVSLGDWFSAGGGSPDQTRGRVDDRHRFVGALGVMCSALFTLVIIAQFLARLFFDPCWS